MVIDHGLGWSPICTGRVLVSIDVALSWPGQETWQYTKNPFTREFRAVRGEKHFCQFYPCGCPDTA